MVDDSPIIRMVLSRMLRDSQLPLGNLYEASNGREALDLLQSKQVDLVLSDINMPLMSGAEMLEIMAMDGLLKTVPVVIVSSEGSQTRIEQLKSTGAVAFIRKPITPTLLREIVSDALGLEASEKKPPLEVATEILKDLLTNYAHFNVGSRSSLPDWEKASPACYARIHFTGAAQGEMVLALSRTTCISLASQLLELPIDHENVQENAEDSLRELLSMTCAHALPQFLGEEAVCNLVPERQTNAMNESSWRKLSENPLTRCLTVEDVPALLYFLCEEPKPGAYKSPTEAQRGRLLEEDELDAF